MDLQGSERSPRASAGPADHAFIEREGELEQFRRLIARSRSGAGSVLLLEGPPGIGKSTLLDHCLQFARTEGMDVLAASGRELESEFALGVALQLFETRLARCDPSERELLLSGPAYLAAPLLSDGPRDLLPEGQPLALLHGLYWLCAHLAERRPLVVAVDDADWADESSLRFLLYLAPRVEELPVTVVLTSSGTRQRPQALAEIAAHPATTATQIAPLTRAGTASLLRRADYFPDLGGRFCKACHEVTGGNPFLLRELAHDLQARKVESAGGSAAMVSELGPEPIARAVTLRVRALGTAATDLLNALAVAGDPCELRHGAALADLDRGEAGRLVDTLVELEILRNSGRIAFAQPIVRQALYLQLPQAERAEAHFRLATMLADEGAPPELVAAHLLESPHAGNAWAVDTLAVAAARAVARGKPASAVTYLRRALEEPPARESRAQVMLELGRAEATAGEREAVGRLSGAVELIEQPHERALASLELGRALYAQGRHEEASEAFRWGAAEAGDLDPELQLQLHAAHTLVTRLVGFSTAKLTDAAPIALPEGADTGDTPASRALLAHVALERALNGAPRADVLKLARSALADGELLRDETSDGLSWYFAATALAIAEDLHGADAALGAAMEHARSRGSAFGFATACFFRSWAALSAGRIDDAAAEAQKAVAAQRYGWRMGLAGAHAVLANVFIERGETGNGRRELERGAEAAATSSETPLPFLVGAEARLSLETGEAADALAQYRDCGERLMAVGITNPACLPWRSGAALACGQLGDVDEAKRLASEELALAREFGAPGAIGRALYAQGRILERGGIEVLREAADVFADSQRKLDQAVTFVALGTALRRAGKLRDARQPLREGLDLAERCGASALAEEARAEAVAAGARPRRTALRGSEALTPRELHVASLAAKGMSNREIASSLFVTIKTVEWHLGHSFVKLGINSRKDLRPEHLGHSHKT